MTTDEVKITLGQFTDMVNDGKTNTVHDSGAPGAVWEARGFVLVADSWNDDGSHTQVWQRKGKAN